ncbi:MAG: hypothetical protein JWR83_3525 [Aeromicrobium sp.]|nr:hypothetical protein [Aeromicrobium sp.]
MKQQLSRRRLGTLAVCFTLLALPAMPAIAATAKPSSTLAASSVGTLSPAASTTKSTTSFGRPAPAPSCGTTLYKADGSKWKCTFADEFNTQSLDATKWVPQETKGSGFGTGSACFLNSANNVSVANGVLSLTARKEAAPLTCSSPYGNFVTSYTAGMVTTWSKFSQAYGRFEIRAKFPAATIAGLQSALWLWPANPSKYGDWPGSGEIDIAEEFSQYADRVVPYVHYNTSLSTDSLTNTGCLISDVSAFHTYVAEWTTSTITIKYDGTTCLVHTISPLAPLTGSQPFDSPFIVALTQGFGLGTNSPTDATRLPGTTQIDYVHVLS